MQSNIKPHTNLNNGNYDIQKYLKWKYLLQINCMKSHIIYTVVILQFL